MISNSRSTKWPLFLAALFAVGMMGQTAMAQVGVGTGGVPPFFEIEGDLDDFNIPGPDTPANDWHTFINADGTTNMGGADAVHHIVDLTKNNDLQVFAGADKLNDDPNTYDWKGGSTPPKDDMNNCNVVLCKLKKIP